MNLNEELTLIINRVLDEEQEKYPELKRIISVASSRQKIVEKVRKFIIADGIEDVSEAIAQVAMEIENKAK
jgi:uncharacterized protein YoaH (UPF0181 family)